MQIEKDNFPAKEQGTTPSSHDSPRMTEERFDVNYRFFIIIIMEWEGKANPVNVIYEWP